jgi:hydrophobe/amphiphile efflux-1 (HAE1) family protein
MLVAVSAKDPNIDIDSVGNFANGPLRDRLLRVPGVGGVQVFGGGLYSMRIWIDPAKAAARNLTASEIIAALRAQNVQTTAGGLGSPPFDSGVTNETPVEVKGRLSDPNEFAQVVIKSDESGAVTRVGDVARVELGAQEYGIRGYFEGKRGIGLAIIQQPGSNALSAAAATIAAVKEAEPSFPAGVGYTIPYNPTAYVEASVEAVKSTLLEAVLLVVLVVVVFLQTWRAAIIPIIAIPVALVGTFAVQLMLGYSINSLSLFALVLAVGIVVDDAIVVVEGVERHIRAGLTPREAAFRTMDEVSGALVSIGLVLLAVFVPTAFVSGIPGEFYRQFAVTISAASVISLLVSLTLSPALAALLLKPHKPDAEKHEPAWLRPIGAAGRTFNRGFEWLSDTYGKLTARLIRGSVIVLIVYAGLLAITGWRLTATPGGFIPDQDQGSLIGVLQLPPGSSLERTDAILKKASKIIADEPGVLGMSAFAGLDGASFTSASNAGTMFIRLKPFAERGHDLSATAISANVTQKLGALQEANVFVLAPPAVRGLGNGGGFKMMIQNRGQGGYRELEAATNAMADAARRPARPKACSPPSTPVRPASSPMSIVTRPSCWACSPTTCSRPWASIWARTTSTTSTIWAVLSG